MRKMNFILIIAALFLFSCGGNKADEKDTKTKGTSEEKSKEVKEGDAKKNTESSANQRAGFPESVRIYIDRQDNDFKYFLHNLKDNSFTYFNTDDATGKGVLMTINKQTGKEYLLAFPQYKTDICKLTLEDAADGIYKLTFVYPDGQKRTFQSPIANACHSIGTGENQETIVGSGPPINYFYYSAKFPEGVLLKITGGDMMEGAMKVSFPQDSKNIYELKEDGKSMTVKNPDGSIQNFKKMD